jgi:hypothetical protein
MVWTAGQGDLRGINVPGALGTGDVQHMKIVFESSGAIVTFLESGHLLHTDRTSGALYRSRTIWENVETAKLAYRNLPGSAWEPVRRPE